MTLVNGPRQSGDTLVCDGEPNRTYHAGEVFRLWGGDQLYSVQEDATAAGPWGHVELRIHPAVDSPNDNAALYFEAGE